MNNPLGKSHKDFITNLEGEERLQAWKSFTERYWREPAGGTPDENVEFLFRRGFYRNRFYAYQLQQPERAELYLSDFQASLLNRVNGVYANVVNDRMLLNHALSAYCNVPRIYALRGFQADEVSLDPLWHAHREGNATAEQDLQVYIQPLDSSAKGRTEIVSISEGRFSNTERSGTMAELSSRVYGWSEAVRCSYLFSELMPQGQFASSLAAGTTNHLHVIMGRNHENWAPHVARVLIEIGTEQSGGSTAIEQGGLSAHVNVKTGVIESCKGLSREGKLVDYKKHPDTKRKLVGAEIPNWDKIKQTLVTIFDESSYFRFCAFNFSLLDNGELGLLGTAKPDVFAAQLHSPLLQDPIVAAQLRSLKL